jgi:hypothetical protein
MAHVCMSLLKGHAGVFVTQVVMRIGYTVGSHRAAQASERGLNARLPPPAADTEFRSALTMSMG